MNKKVIELILDDSSMNGTVSAEVKWHDCRAVKLSRESLRKVAPFSDPGFYLLFCEDVAPGVKCVYVGESENVHKRLLQHISAYNAGSESFYWSTAIVFTGHDLNKSTCLFVEHELRQRIQTNGHKCLTKSSRPSPISAAEQIHVEQIISHVSDLLYVFGCPLLTAKAPHDGSVELFCSGNGANARGFRSAGGFTVSSGSSVSSGMSPSLSGTGYGLLRTQLEQSGIIKDGALSVAYEFPSPSAAASVVLGSPANGLGAWKAADGTPLKEL